MSAESTKSALKDLTDADLLRIVANPLVGREWAKIAKVNYTELKRGNPRAMRSVRVAIMRRHGGFVHSLAHAWELLVDPQDVADLDGDALLLHAQMAGYQLGPTGGRAMLLALSEDNHLADADAVRERLDELLDAAERGADFEPSDAEEPDEAAREEAAEEDNVEGEDAASEEVAVVDLEELQVQAVGLLDQAPALVGQLRAAANAIEQGTPAAALGDGADNWSDAVQSVLDEAAVAGIEDSTALPAVLDRLRDLAAERADQVSARRSNALLTLQMIDVLRQAGRAEMIGDQLALHGFTSVEEAEEAAGVRAVPPAATDEAEPVGPDSAADLQPETTPGPAVEVVETATPTAPVTKQQLPADNAPTPPREDIAAAPEAATATPVVNAEQHSPPPTAVETLNETSASPDEYPWDEGDPPIIGQLLLTGREAMAYHMAVAASEVKHRRQLLLFACAAAHCTSDAIDVSLLPSEAQALDTNESLLLLAASLRAGLRLGYPPIGFQSLLDRADEALTDTALIDVLHAVAVAVQRGHGRHRTAAGPSAEEMATRWTDLGDKAGAELIKLRQKNLRFQRGSKVLRHLSREGQPIADALAAAQALTAQGVTSASDPEWGQIEVIAAELGDNNDRERILLAAEAAVSHAGQRMRPIDGPVKTQLGELLLEIDELLSRLITLRRSILAVPDLSDLAIGDDLERALSQAPINPAVHSVGDAAVANFVQWLRTEEDDVDPGAESVQEVLDAALLELFEIPRDELGGLRRDPTLNEIALALSPRDSDQVVSGYLETGNVSAARDFIAARGLEGVGYDDKIQQAVKAAKSTYKKAYGDAEDGTARLRALYNEDLAKDLAERIQQIAESPRNDRFDLAIDGLRAITAEAEAALSAERENLIQQVGELNCDEASKQRVLQRIEARDEPLAVYFLSVLRAGGTLQEVEPPSGDDFSEFVPRIVGVAADAYEAGNDVVAAVRAALQAGDTITDRFRDGLAGWQHLKEFKRSGDGFKGALDQVLRMIGLTPKTQTGFRDVSTTAAGGYATLRVSASPVDRSYVPEFGSQAFGEYDVTLVWDKASPSRLMDFIGEGKHNRANIILYFGVLSLAERRHLRTLTRTTAGGSGFSPLVIDEAVVGWLTHRPEPGWRYTQRITLPFTTVNPYQPTNAIGEVPEEVFVGRNEERALIVDMAGAMFVYGGRQLGKSALLHRVARLYHELRPAEVGAGMVGRAVVYVDLRPPGIGEAQEPAHLWSVLGERLHKVGILDGKSPPRLARDVTSGILAWLESEESNRLLLLLDEADNFLTVDSKPRGGENGGFPVLNTLKGVMEQSRGRFKAVFAGLHQVQRFHDASNTPVAHGGDAILIGPLRTHDASHLVADPIGALGYKFENPELVWRLLLVTNYQPSLVQVVCEALVRYLQDRPIPEAGGRMIITTEDVRSVCSDPKVRDNIAQRFRWTINLDSRYRVIALVVAFNSIGAEPGVRFSLDDLRDECERSWPAGFSPEELSRNEFERYLEEMQGLGILQKHDADLWALSSPNVIQMLGTRDRLRKELDEAEHLERPLEYNPTMARHIMGDSEGSAAPRSPLTDYELAQLLKQTANNRNVATAQVVFGSPALGIDRVIEVIERQALRENGHPAIVVDSLQSPDLKRAGAGGKRAHVIVDLREARPDGKLAHTCREAAARKNVTATVVVGPAWLESLDTLDEQVPVHKLRRWSIAGLRTWYGSPFDLPPDRVRLHRATSGWPKLIEEVMDDFSKNTAPQDCLERLTASLATSDRAKEILADTGMDPQIAKAWVKGIPFSGTGAAGVEQLPVSVEDISQALGLDGSQLVSQLEALDLAEQEDDNWFLDRVVLAAAADLYQGQD